MRLCYECIAAMRVVRMTTMRIPYRFRDEVCTKEPVLLIYISLESMQGNEQG